jgi:3-dehydroquinate synthase
MKTLKSIGYSIELGSDALAQLNQFLKNEAYSSYFIICDENTLTHCLPALLSSCKVLKDAEVIEVESGEASKDIEIASHIWQTLIELKADKQALIINLGGGVVSDLGGFLASVYKRGIDFINIPTSLLAMADASIGGKTGIDLGAVKNVIGTITQPKGVFINFDFLNSLPERHVNNGLAEVYKMALISDALFWKKLSSKTKNNDLENVITKSITLKNTIVKKDPLEKNSRKALNFGHTIGHAIESVLLGTECELLHGEAIVIGMITEAWLSNKKKLLTKTELQNIVSVLKAKFNPQTIHLSYMDSIVEIALNDKKNSKNEIRCVLLNGVGDYKIDMAITPVQIKKALEYYNSVVE